MLFTFQSYRFIGSLISWGLIVLNHCLGAKKAVDNDVAKVWSLTAQDVNDDDLVSILKKYPILPFAILIS